MHTIIKVVISGSFRKHIDDIRMARANFQKAHIKIFAPLTTEIRNISENFVFLTTDNAEKSAYVLEKEFMTNILKADFLYLANIEGYVGHSSATEMGVACMHKVPIVVAEKITYFSDEIPKTAQELLKKTVYAQIPIHEISSSKIAKLHFSKHTPFNISPTETALLQSLIEKLLQNLQFISVTT